MKRIVLILTIFTLLVFLVAPVSAKSEKAKGPVDKTTGEVWWTRGNISVYGVFNAHELNETEHTGKGHFYYYENSPSTGESSFEVNVEGAMIKDDHACFWGTTYNATNVFSTRNGQKRYWFVKDGGEPQMDNIRGRWTNNNYTSECNTSNYGFLLDSGNLQVHTYNITE